MRKKVLIDVTSTIPRKGSYISGIGKSTYWLIDALNKKADIPFDIELCATGIKSIGFDFYNWHFKHHVIPVPKSLHVGKTNVACLWRNCIIKHDLFHIPHIVDYVQKNEKYVSTFHDLDAYSICQDERKKELYWDIAQESKGIICCSKFSKKEVSEKLNINSEKIKVVYWGCDRQLFRNVPQDTIRETLNKYDISKPYFFACSCSNPRKNIETALKAFRSFLSVKPKHCFVIAWGNPRKEILEEYAYEIANRKIIILPFIDDRELVNLYNGASMSVYVTRKEGFGFPILESFSCGTPVMTCRNSCLEEVGRDAAIYVGEDDVESMREIMITFEENRYDYDLFKQRSLFTLNQFSWEKCADEYIQFYSDCLK